MDNSKIYTVTQVATICSCVAACSTCFRCTCPDFSYKHYQRACKHIFKVAELLDSGMYFLFYLMFFVNYHVSTFCLIMCCFFLFWFQLTIKLVQFPTMKLIQIPVVQKMVKQTCTIMWSGCMSLNLLHVGRWQCSVQWGTHEVIVLLCVAYALYLEILFKIWKQSQSILVLMCIASLISSLPYLFTLTFL